MFNKFLKEFWKETKKKKKWGNKIPKERPIEKSLKVKIEEHNALSLLVRDLRNIYTKSEKEYEKCLNTYKNEIENYVKKYFDYQSQIYNSDLEQHNKPSLEELFKVVPIKELVNNPFDRVFINNYLPLQIKEISIKNPPDSFPAARQMHRMFYIHVGGTNTGKTYNSIEKLKKAKSGAYLGPLRLLALEIQDKLNDAGVLCSLVTGEERDIIEGANHVASTVEMCNTNVDYELVVIDECQMIGDRWRGGHWARAIMGVRSHEIHLCVAPEGLEIVKKLIEACGDMYEVENHERTTPLSFQSINGFNMKRDIQKGDALIVFSRKKVLSLAADLSKMGINASVIYGALPYNTRKKQMERFINGETDVVVATDAIGMGLNLPIKRVIFMELNKFDGEEDRMLEPEEIKQIAGRAGRRGIYDEGFACSIVYERYLQKALTYNVNQIEGCYLNFPETLLSLNGEIEDIMKKWHATQFSDAFEKQDISIILKLISLIKNMNFSKEELYSLATIAFDEKNEVLMKYWISCCRAYKAQREISKPILSKDSLFNMETSYKLLDLYFAFCQKMQQTCDEEWIKENKMKLSEEINKALLEEMKNNSKKCKSCGKPLSWDYQFGICDKCYKKRYRNRYVEDFL